jgi:hypothetical protein
MIAISPASANFHNLSVGISIPKMLATASRTELDAMGKHRWNVLHQLQA